MTARQEAKLNMYDAVMNHCDGNPAITGLISAFNVAFTLFKTKVAELKTAAQSEKVIISGIALDKGEQKKSLAQMAATISSTIFAFAESTNNLILREKMTHNFSSIMRLRDEDVVHACRNIHAEATVVEASLVSYGISAATLTLLEAAIDNYATKVPAPRNAASLRATFRTAIATLIKEIDSILKNRMDKIVVQYKAVDMLYYNTYKNNRIILDPVAIATRVAGTITSTTNDIGISGVQVTVIGQIFSAATDAQGSYIMRTPVAGTYTIKYEKEGFETKEIPGVVVHLGQITTLNTQLNPLAP